MKILAAALLCILFSFGPALGSGAAPGKLRIGVDAGYPPFSYVDDAGALKGFDIDIALTLCAKLNTACTFVRQAWEQLIPGLRAGKYDAIVSSMSITEKRRRLVAFTERYYSNVVRFVARKGAGFDPSAPAGRKIGVARATIASDWLEDKLSGVASIRLFTEQAALLRALDEGIGIAVRKEDDTLRRRLNMALKTILTEGAYEKINARYFPFSIY